MMECKIQKTMTKAKPFLKWAGGKRSLLPQLHPLLPKALIDGKLDSYHEPFLGGGAMFFHLFNEGLLPDKVFLSDSNPCLINVWQVIKSESGVKALIQNLERKQSIYWNNSHSENKGYYQLVRNEYNDCSELTTGVKTSQAAAFIFLNKTCFNGLYRVNKQGEFNVPMGTYRKPKILDKENLWACHKALFNAEITTRPHLVSFTNPNSFTYFDPPYRTGKDKSKFISYNQDAFDDEKLTQYVTLRVQPSRGYWMLSNADIGDGFLESLLPPHEYHWHYLMAKRSISCKGNGREPAKEVVITNY